MINHQRSIETIVHKTAFSTQRVCAFYTSICATWSCPSTITQCVGSFCCWWKINSTIPLKTCTEVGLFNVGWLKVSIYVQFESKEWVCERKMLKNSYHEKRGPKSYVLHVNVHAHVYNTVITFKFLRWVGLYFNFLKSGTWFSNESWEESWEQIWQQSIVRSCVGWRYTRISFLIVLYFFRIDGSI